MKEENLFERWFLLIEILLLLFMITISFVYFKTGEKNNKEKIQMCEQEALAEYLRLHPPSLSKVKNYGGKASWGKWSQNNREIDMFINLKSRK